MNYVSTIVGVSSQVPAPNMHPVLTTLLYPTPEVVLVGKLVQVFAGGKATSDFSAEKFIQETGILGYGIAAAVRIAEVSAIAYLLLRKKRKSPARTAAPAVRLNRRG